MLSTFFFFSRRPVPRQINLRASVPTFSRENAARNRHAMTSIGSAGRIDAQVTRVLPSCRSLSLPLSLLSLPPLPLSLLYLPLSRRRAVVVHGRRPVGQKTGGRSSRVDIGLEQLRSSRPSPRPRGDSDSQEHTVSKNAVEIKRRSSRSRPTLR